MMIDGDHDLETGTSQSMGVQGATSGKGTEAVGTPLASGRTGPALALCAGVEGR